MFKCIKTQIQEINKTNKIQKKDGKKKGDKKKNKKKFERLEESKESEPSIDEEIAQPPTVPTAPIQVQPV